MFQLHGNITRHDSLVFTSTDYRNVIHSNQGLRTFLTSVLSTKTVLFLGFSLSDPHIDMVLRYLKTAYGGVPVTHYALLSEPSQLQRDSHINKSGIRTIEYTPHDDSHPEVRDFVGRLKERGRTMVVHPPHRPGAFRDLVSAARSLTDWLIATETHWGRLQHAAPAHRTVANTAEGLFLYLTPVRLHEALGIVDLRLSVRKEAWCFLLQTVSDEGLPSVSLGKPTIQCTSLGLYVMSVLAQRTPERPVSQDVLTTKLSQLVESLKTSAGDFGWGTEIRKYTNEGEIRTAFNFWAMRALNSADPDGSEKLIEGILDNMFLKHGGRQFGFSMQDPAPAVASEALFLILLDELRSERLRDRFRQYIENSAWPLKNRLAFLLDCLTRGKYVEYEQYHVCQSDRVPLQYNWWHVSFGYALYCLALYHDSLDAHQQGRLREGVDRFLGSRLIRRREGTCIPLAENRDSDENPSTFPAAYVLMGLSEYIDRAAGEKRWSLTKSASL